MNIVCARKALSKSLDLNRTCTSEMFPCISVKFQGWQVGNSNTWHKIKLSLLLAPIWEESMLLHVPGPVIASKETWEGSSGYSCEVCSWNKKGESYPRWLRSGHVIWLQRCGPPLRKNSANALPNGSLWGVVLFRTSWLLTRKTWSFSWTLKGWVLEALAVLRGMLRKPLWQCPHGCWPSQELLFTPYIVCTPKPIIFFILCGLVPLIKAYQIREGWVMPILFLGIQSTDHINHLNFRQINPGFGWRVSVSAWGERLVYHEGSTYLDGWLHVIQIKTFAFI